MSDGGRTTGFGAIDGPTDKEYTVQLLVEDEGNRATIRSMLDERYAVDTAESIGDADLYLVEDRLFSQYADDLRTVVADEEPVFCPVVLIQRADERVRVSLSSVDDRETPLLVDDVIKAPVGRALLVRRLDTLLVRRTQAQRLQTQVSTLEARERELRSFKQAVEHSGHSITITDTGGTIQFVNSAFEETTGYTESEALGENPRLLKSGEHDKRFYADLWGTILDGEAWEGEVINERKSGERYVVDQTIAPILDDGEIEGFISVNSEMTDRIRRERELQRHQQELDLLRQILTRILRHNIRNDLNVILGHAERLDTEYDGPIDGIDKIIEKAESLTETSETAREIAALINRSDSPSRQDIAAIVERVVTDVRDQFPDTTICVTGPAECPAYASNEFQQAVRELVENAAEHNDDPDPRIDVTLERDGPIRLSIEDNGRGIPESELVPLRQDEETPLAHGSSVDLWLVDWIVKQSNGSIQFDSSTDGTRVVVELPRNEVIDDVRPPHDHD